MKILLDTCVWGGARKTLEAAGHDVEWTGDWPQDPGDDAILAHAFQEGRILVTLGKDFGELAIVFYRPHRKHGPLGESQRTRSRRHSRTASPEK